jgi:hypothetical protein
VIRVEDVAVLHARPRLRHHGRHGVAPGGVVGGLFVRDGGLLRAVDFHQDEVGGVGVVLKDVEAGDARLLHAGGRIGEGGGFEGVDVGGIDVDVDVDDEHGEFSPSESEPIIPKNPKSAIEHSVKWEYTLSILCRPKPIAAGANTDG